MRINYWLCCDAKRAFPSHTHQQQFRSLFLLCFIRKKSNRLYIWKFNIYSAYCCCFSRFYNSLTLLFGRWLNFYNLSPLVPSCNATKKIKTKRKIRLSRELQLTQVVVLCSSAILEKCSHLFVKKSIADNISEG